MSLKTLECTLSRLADSTIFGELEHQALMASRDLVATIREAGDLPFSFHVSDLLPLIRHKFQLPERPQTIIRLPSCDGPIHDRYAVLPAGLGVTAAIAAANAVIQRVNTEASAEGQCEDGLDVENNLRRQLEPLGFAFLPVEETNHWDESVNQPAMA